MIEYERAPAAFFLSPLVFFAVRRTAWIFCSFYWLVKDFSNYHSRHLHNWICMRKQQPKYPSPRFAVCRFARCIPAEDAQSAIGLIVVVMKCFASSLSVPWITARRQTKGIKRDVCTPRRPPEREREREMRPAEINTHTTRLDWTLCILILAGEAVAVLRAEWRNPRGLWTLAHMPNYIISLASPAI